MSLVDISTLPGYGGGNRAAALIKPFKKLDNRNRGILGLADFASAIESVGLVLTAGEIRAIAHNFMAEIQRRGGSRSPSKGERSGSKSPSKSPSKGGSVGVDYFSFVKFLLEVSTMNRGISGDNGWDGDNGPRRGFSAGEWWTEIPKVARKVKGYYKKAKNKKKWLKSLRGKFEEKEDEGGSVSGKKFGKVLGKSKIKLGKGMLNELIEALGGSDGCDWNSFVEVFTADSADSSDDDDSSDDGKKKKRKKKNNDSDDDSDSDDSDDDSDSDGSDDDSDSEAGEGLFQLFAKIMMKQSDPRQWLDSVCYLFSDSDSDGNGYLDAGEFYGLCHRIGMKLKSKQVRGETMRR